MLAFRSEHAHLRPKAGWNFGLEEAGLRVSEAENGSAAIHKAGKECFDVILMDVQMPVMDGLTATRRLREAGQQVPIIALTAHAMKGFERTVLEAGCTGYLTKPIDVDKVLALLARLLNGTPASTLMVTNVFPLPNRDQRVKAAEKAPLVSRLADHPRLGAVVRRFVQRMPEDLEAIQQAWRLQDYGTLAALAHKLKGAGGTLGFDEFTEPASALERFANERNGPGAQDAIAEIAGLVERLDVQGARHASEVQIA